MTFEMPTGFWLDNLKVRDHWEDQGISVKIILKWIFLEIWCEGVD